MNPVIMKFGGASVASPKSILRVADLIVERKKECSKLVVVVSAMANMTDQLLGLARSIHPNPPKREEDMLVSVGERISIALLAMALNLKGLNAISFTGSH
jgi:aspartate kinase